MSSTDWKNNNMNTNMYMYKIRCDTLVAYIVCPLRIGRICDELNFKRDIPIIARYSYTMVYNLMIQIFNIYVLFSQANRKFSLVWQLRNDMFFFPHEIIETWLRQMECTQDYKYELTHFLKDIRFMTIEYLQRLDFVLPWSSQQKPCIWSKRASDPRDACSDCLKRKKSVGIRNIIVQFGAATT